MREHKERMSLYSSLVLFSSEKGMSVLPLEKDMFVSPVHCVCFCSVVHRTVDTSARSCFSAHTIHNLVCVGSSSRLCGSHKN